MTLWRSTNARQSRNAMARRLVMLLAIVICVRANRWAARAEVSSAFSDSSAIHRSSQTSGGNAPLEDEPAGGTGRRRWR